MNEITPKVVYTPGAIQHNLADLKAAIENQMQAYEALEVTEDNIKERKKDIATLRKEKNVIEDERKRVKEEFSAPLRVFESEVKEVTGKIDDQITRLDGQVKAFDKKRVEEKQKHIQELYDQNISGMQSFLPLSAIKQSKWDNATCNDNEIIFDIQERVMRVRGDLDAIKALHSEYEDAIINAYRSSGNNLSVAIQRSKEYEEIAKRKEEQERARQEAERARIEAEKAQAEAKKEEAPAAPVSCQPAEPVPVWSDDAMNPPTMTIKVTGAEAVEALRNFLELSGIDFEEV